MAEIKLIKNSDGSTSYGAQVRINVQVDLAIIPDAKGRHSVA